MSICIWTYANICRHAYLYICTYANMYTFTHTLHIFSSSAEVCRCAYFAYFKHTLHILTYMYGYCPYAESMRKYAICKFDFLSSDWNFFYSIPWPWKLRFKHLIHIDILTFGRVIDINSIFSNGRHKFLYSKWLISIETWFIPFLDLENLCLDTFFILISLFLAEL